MAKFSGDTSDKGYQAFRILQIAFIILPIVAGLDKFFNILVNWCMYVAPLISQMINHHDKGFMMIVGIIEIIVGIGVIFNPRVFAYIIFIWLLAIIINLLLSGRYFDIALRDFGLALAALALAKLSEKYMIRHSEI